MHADNDPTNDTPHGAGKPSDQQQPDQMDAAWTAMQSGTVVIRYGVGGRQAGDRLRHLLNSKKSIDLADLLTEADHNGSLHNTVRRSLRSVIAAYHACAVADGNDGATKDDVEALAEAVATLQVRVGMITTYTLANQAAEDRQEMADLLDDATFIRDDDALTNDDDGV